MPIRLAKDLVVEIADHQWFAEYTYTKGMAPTPEQHGHPPSVEVHSVSLIVNDTAHDFTEFMQQFPAFQSQLTNAILAVEIASNE